MDFDAVSRGTSPDFETALTTDDRLELRIWLRLLTCSNLIEGHVRKRLHREFGTTLPRFDLLSQLDRAPDGLAMGELSRRLMVSNGNVTGLIDRLVGEELVERRPAPDDRRSHLVRLTAKGKRTFDGMTPAHQEWVEGLLAGLDREQMTEIYEGLGRMKQSLSKGLDAADAKGPVAAGAKGPVAAGAKGQRAASAKGQRAASGREQPKARANTGTKTGTKTGAETEAKSEKGER